MTSIVDGKCIDQHYVMIFQHLVEINRLIEMAAGAQFGKNSPVDPIVLTFPASSDDVDVTVLAP